MPKKQGTDQQETLALEHERLNSLISSMADGVIAIDDDNIVVLYNGAALNILDANSSFQGIPLTKVLHLYDTNGQPIDVRKLIKSTTIATSSRDYLMHYDDGSKANIYLSIAPVRLGYGVKKGDSGFVLLLRDITHEKSLEEERDEFISVVSHELRTPIAIAEGNVSNTQLMVDNGLPIDKIKEALKVAHDQIIFLAGMINDLATLSRAERGKLTLDVEPINPHQLIEDLVKSYEAEASAKGLKLRSDLDPHLETLHSGTLYVREILQNFITNAIKYTEKGSVVLGAQKMPGGVKFTVSDTGIGISKVDVEKVFDKFFRSEDFRTRATSGTGLGLYVTMKLANLLHADISVNSELNKGSVFTIIIPDIESDNTTKSS